MEKCYVCFKNMLCILLLHKIHRMNLYNHYAGEHK